MSAAPPLAPISDPGFHRAPHGRVGRPLRPSRPDFATAAVEAGFDWADCLADTPQSTFYLVVFRSVRKAGVDTELLTEFDDLAHAEARLSGGLHFYFKGEPRDDRACLSMCLWDSQEQARAALRLPRHQAAAQLSRHMYESFGLERYHVAWEPVAASITFSPA
jgi:heme-degrading monooxygenase HmoA